MTKKPPSKTSAYAIGLRWALFFLISFFVLGYSPILSIVLGVTGGVATGVIFVWWQTKEDSAFRTPTEVNEQESEGDRRSEKSLTRSERWKRQGSQTGIPSLKSLKWPFRRR